MSRRASGRTARTGLLIGLPASAVGLSLLTWVTAVSRSGFWADDFLFLTHFNRTLGDLSDTQTNTGKYVANLFWAVGTSAFGTGSVVPFLLLNSLVFGLGVGLWLWAGTRGLWDGRTAWWTGGLFVATAAWFSTALWSANITHSAGFLALGAALVAHQSCMRATRARAALAWSLACGLAWLGAVVSDLLYIGLLVLAACFAWEQLGHLRRLGRPPASTAALLGAWSLGLSLVFFGFVAYPATTGNQAYATNGIRFIRGNLHFYKAALAPSAWLTVIYVAVLGLGLAAGAVAAWRRRDLLPLALLGAAGATALPALVQSQQRDVHYLAMPLLLTFSALAAGAHPLLLGVAWRRARGGALVAAGVALVLVFAQGADIRSFFVTSPFGRRLAAFREDIAALTPGSAPVCAKLYLEPQVRSVFIAQMSGAAGFRVPPINAASVALVPSTGPCPVGSAVVTVGVDRRGDFVAGK